MQCNIAMTAASAVSEGREGSWLFFKFIYPREGKYLLSLSAEVLPDRASKRERRKRRGIIYLVKGSRNKKALDLHTGLTKIE